MPLKAGTPREWLRPAPVGNDEHQARGDHRGDFEALNVRNAQAGFTYYYVRRTANKVQRFLNQGWIPVRDVDPEKWGAELPPEVGEGLDGMKAFRDVMLFKIPNDRYAEIKRQKAEDARAAREGGTRGYLDLGQDRARQLGRSAPQGELYYQRPSHHTTEE